METDTWGRDRQTHEGDRKMGERWIHGDTHGGDTNTWRCRHTDTWRHGDRHMGRDMNTWRRTHGERQIHDRHMCGERQIHVGRQMGSLMSSGNKVTVHEPLYFVMPFPYLFCALSHTDHCMLHYL